MDLDNLVPNVARMLGINPTTALLFLWILVMGAGVISRLIPEDATGWRGLVRKIAKLIGAQVSNRVTGGLTVNDAATLILATAKAPVESSKIKEVVEKVQAVQPTTLEEPK